MTPYESGLYKYADSLLEQVWARGYTIIYAGDLRTTREADLCRGTNPVRARARTEWLRAANDESHERSVSAVAHDLNGYVTWPDDEYTGVCALPDRDGAVRRFASSHNLDYAALRAAGVTDADVFALIAVHEASHIIGNSGPGHEDSTALEYTTYALHTARLLNAGMNPATLALINNAHAQQSFLHAAAHADEDYAYDRILSATAWAARHADDPTVWDGAADCFTPEAYEHLHNLGSRIAAVGRKTLDAALIAMGKTKILGKQVFNENDPAFTALFCAAAEKASANLRMKGHITLDGPDENLQAALLLRQIARAGEALRPVAPHP